VNNQTDLGDAWQKSPLDDVVRRHGATMTTRHGRRVAAHFGSMATETAVCTGALGILGIADRFDRTTIKLRAEPMDARSALAALERLPQRTWSAPLSAGGAIVRCEHANTDVCLDALRQFKDAVAVDASDQYAAIEIVGPRVHELLEACGFDARNQPPIVLRETDTAFEVLVAPARAPEVWERLLEFGHPLGIACVGIEALEYLSAARRRR
jgi:glycine cleavage system aminomethyltransferase T